MASIISTKRNKDGVVLEIQTNYDEFLELEGNMDKIHILAEKEQAIDTHISQRGNNGATKYFLIPRELRKGFKFDNKISCQRINQRDKILFVYVVDTTLVNEKGPHITEPKTEVEALS